MAIIILLCFCCPPFFGRSPGFSFCLLRLPFEKTGGAFSEIMVVETLCLKCGKNFFALKSHIRFLLYPTAMIILEKMAKQFVAISPPGFSPIISFRAWSNSSGKLTLRRPVTQTFRNKVAPVFVAVQNNGNLCQFKNCWKAPRRAHFLAQWIMIFLTGFGLSRLGFRLRRCRGGTGFRLFHIETISGYFAIISHS